MVSWKDAAEINDEVCKLALVIPKRTGSATTGFFPLETRFLFRFNKSMITLKAALSKIKNELILFSFITFILLYISSIGIYFFENSAQPENFKSIFHCLWWAVCTLTTVGYGDIYPITNGGKIFTGIVTLIGVGIIAIPTGLIASSFISALKENELE